MGEAVLSRLNTRRLLWECEKDSGATGAYATRRLDARPRKAKCIQAARLKATFFTKTAKIKEDAETPAINGTK